MQKEITILFVSHSSGLYGSEKSLLDIITGLQNIASIRAIVLVPGKGYLTTILDQKNIEYIKNPFLGWLGRNHILLKGTYRVLVNAKACINLLLQIRCYSIDLIYTNTILSPIGSIIAWNLKIPHIWHVREFVHEDMGAQYDFGTRNSMLFIEKTTDAIICNSIAVYNKMVRYLSPSKLTVVYNGVLNASQREQFSARQRLLHPSNVRLCIVGSITPSKGQKEAIQALQMLLNQGIEAELHIVGTGNKTYVQSLKTLAVSMGIANRVYWEGYIADVEEVFASSDIALVCSRSEAFGRVVVEAMATGCPVIGTNAGGIPEIIDHEVNGLLYQPGNIVDLTNQICKLIQQPDLYAQLSQNAIPSVYNRFTHEQHITKITTLIDTCIEHGVGCK